MSGSDGDEEAFASLVDVATFKQRMANEVAQLEAALQILKNDIIEASRLRAIGARPATGRVDLRSARTFFGHGSASNPFTPWVDRSKIL